MKKLLVVILLSLSACKHETPIEKAKPVIIRYLDSVGKHGLISDINRFKQIDKYSFTCEFRIKEGGTGFPLYATGLFKLDTSLLKVKHFDYETH